MAMAPERMGIGIRRHFTAERVHPYDELTWVRRDARITNYRDGSVAFEQPGVEVPDFWSVNATNILAQKYFRGPLGSPEREWSLRQVSDRVADTTEAEAFNGELKHLVVNQKAAFNSPVWFNIGVPGRPAQAAACFILSVGDSMNEILNWYVEEGIIFKGGSGSGVNLSRIRSSKEQLSGGGTASGPVSFMRGADASAGTIKSGGTTRRAAKMVILNADHPDIEEFIWCKAIEERKARALREAGFDVDLDGKDSHSIQYQNANNSVRVTDEFMQAVLDDADWHLRAVTTGEVLRTVKARELFRQIAKAAWECADPGVQYDTTINRWHTLHASGPITASNPCSEYLSVDNSACNLASLNLLKFLGDDGAFDVEGFKAAVEVVFTAQEILVGNADYPTEKIAENARRFRQLGLGYANLGALLMALGMPYDGDDGRAWAAAITALMTGHAYATSARTAARMGPFAGYTANREHMLRVLRMHREEVARIDEERVQTSLLDAAQEAWDSAVETADCYGVRNSQATVLAPTGCLVGGSLVATERGLVRLRSIGDTSPDADRWQPLDLAVQTDEGPRMATRFYLNGLEPVVHVETACGYRISGTPQHRVKVVHAASGNWEWKRLADIGEGDVVPLALDQLIGVAQPVPLPPLPAPDGGVGRDRRRMTPALAELAGYFIGAGSLDAGALRFSVPDDDLEVVARLEQLGKEVFGRVSPARSEGGTAEVRIDAAGLVSWWEACGLAPDPLPHVPDAVLHTNDREVYASFLRGLFQATGSVRGGDPVWSTTAIELSLEVQGLLLALGYPTRRTVETPAPPGAAPLAVLALLDASRNRRWVDEIGFMGDRMNGQVRISSAGGDNRIPLDRELAERLSEGNLPGPLVEVAGATISRRVATELLQRTSDPELAHLVSFFYDTVASARLGDEELTYDLSVPGNVTYLANGFVSHNTIGLLMDCDTTGIEPDLGLVKMKKLVGGGTMSIVNQTVPRALRMLGYSDDQVGEIVAHIDEHKSIIGAPHLSADHLAVFACSMGDLTIHHLGHIRMMAAVQPWISGAISKTCNVPENATVEEIEQLYVDAWRLGLKAVAIYRDNCKVAQPLSTVKKDAPASEAEAHDQELAVKIAELEKALDRQTVVVKQPIRERLPRKRRSSTFAFRVADCEGYVTVGEYDDGRPGEVFMKVSKQGSTLAGIMDAFSIAVSLGLQHGVPLKTFVQKYTNMRFEPAGITDDADLRIASSLVDYIFRRLAVDYLPHEERLELGIQTTDERTQPTLPGVEETVTPNQPLVDPAPPAPEDRRVETTSEARRVAASDAPYCMECGVQMIRSGSCHACPSCGTTSGCS
jgi:ribonucleoside-diphosphate reductase alpha chain